MLALSHNIIDSYQLTMHVDYISITVTPETLAKGNFDESSLQKL